MEIIMPHSEDAELSIISTCLNHPNEAADICDILSSEHLYSTVPKTIFTAIEGLVGAGKYPDLVHLKGVVNMPISDLADIMHDHPIAPHNEKHCELIISYYAKRQLIEKSNAIMKRAQGSEDVQAVMDFAESELSNIGLYSDNDGTHISDLSEPTLERLDELSKQKGLISGLETGFYGLDAMTSGLQDSDLVIIAARPSMGKTALGLNIIENISKRSPVPCAFFSLEMSKEQLHMRMITSQSRVNAQSLRTGQVPKEHWGRVVSAVGEINEWPVYINDMVYTCGGIRRAARNLKRKHDIKLIVVDYLQLIKVAGNRRHDLEIGEISGNLKQLAKELNIPVIVLSQLNRKLEDRGDKRPMLADLRDSGALEQDADLVVFVYRDEVYNEGKDKHGNPNGGCADLIIAKQRSGPVGTVSLSWLGHYTRFENRAREI